MPGNNESTLVVQVRTTRVGNANATGFTGIAVKEGNAEVIQVNLKPKGKMAQSTNDAHWLIYEVIYNTTLQAYVG